jgi:lipopolysaccharide exporter
MSRSLPSDASDRRNRKAPPAPIEITSRPSHLQHPALPMNRAIATGAAWMLLLRLGDRLLGVVSILLLARLLLPADFGLVAMAMSVISLLELGTNFGFELALIQKTHPTKVHYDTAWTLQVAFGSFCAVMTAALAYPAGLFYGEGRLPPVMLVLAAGWFLQSFENIGMVEFRRRMEFSRESVLLGTKRLVGFLVTLSTAWLLQTYWALVAGMIAGRLTGVVLSYIMQPYRPRISLAGCAELFSFSSWILAVNVLDFATRRSSHFVIGRLHGSVALGLYSMSSEIASLPSTDLIAPINRAVFPGYARTAGDPEAFRENFLRVVGTIWILALPASFGVAAIAEPLVRTLLGNKWMGAVILIQILAVSGVLNAATSNNYSAWLALGKTRTVALVTAVQIVLLFPLLLILSHIMGVVGVAWAELIAMLGAVIVECFMVTRALGLPLRRYVVGLWRPLTAATLMALGVTVLLHEMSNGFRVTSSPVQLVVAVPVGAVIYVSTLAALWLLSGRPRSTEAFVLERLAQLVFRR